MTSFTDGVKREGNWKKTENYADALKSTTNSLVDLFATIGALRSRPDRDVESKFTDAFNEDKLLATKMSFYARNIRGGLGERRVARTIWKWLANNQTSTMKKNLSLVPLFGRWDDLYSFIGTPVEDDMWKLLISQWNEDLENLVQGNSISLLAKWLKSVNTSSKESVKLGKRTAQVLGYSEKEYRKVLSSMRTHLRIVEKAMSSKEWKLINYEQVPSKAMTNYRKAFSKQDPTRFVAYLEAVKKGTATIHSATLYPYDIVEKIFKGEKSDVLEEQWKALPNYVEPGQNMLVMADVSGSMYGRPICTSIGLAIYFAERNTGAYHNLFMTFSSDSHFITLKDSQNLYQKVKVVKDTEWGGSTNIEAAFYSILKVALENKVPKEEMPKSLIIISDMEFNMATTEYSYSSYYRRNEPPKTTYYEKMKKLFESHGYELPIVVFWNVDARQDTFHAELKDGVQFASGQSTSVFKSLISGANLGPYELMLQTLNSPMYEAVTI